MEGGHEELAELLVTFMVPLPPHPRHPHPTQRAWTPAQHHRYPRAFNDALAALFLAVRRTAHRSVYKDLRLHLARDLALVWDFFQAGA